MKIIINNRVYSDGGNIYYKDDLIKLQKLMMNLGFERIPLEDLETMWREISESYCAGFLCVPDNEENLLKYIEGVAIYD